MKTLILQSLGPPGPGWGGTKVPTTPHRPEPPVAGCWRARGLCALSAFLPGKAAAKLSTPLSSSPRPSPWGRGRPSGSTVAIHTSPLPGLWFLALVWLLALSGVHAQTPPTLIQQVISREFSVYVGGVQTPEYKELVSREVSLFIGDEPSPPYRQVISREVSIVVTTPEWPAKVSPLVVTPAPTGESVTLSWLGYNEWAQKDIVRYDI